jgi:mono/diheme cytochrome c family protein
MRGIDLVRPVSRAAIGFASLLALLSATGCSGSMDGGADPRRNLDVELPDGGAPPSEDPEDAANKDTKKDTKYVKPAADECETLATETRALLMEHCASCHAGGAKQGGFGDVLNVERMLAQGKIVSGEPSESKLFNMVKSGAMPRNNTKLTADEVATLEGWIECGPPNWPATSEPAHQAAYLGVDQRLQAMYNDLRTIENPTDRTRVRYLDFSHLSNGGMDDDDVEAYRQIASFLLNSLSQGSRVVVPESVDDEHLLYRIDLRDYGWSTRTWDLLVAEYPYAVRYDADSRLFPFDEELAQSVREDTETLVPYIHADWFMAHATIAPLYYQLLEFPANALTLAQDLGVDVRDNIVDSQVARAGFAASGVSVNNRIIERHEQPGFAGAFWLSYDFISSDGQRNIFAHPVDFAQDAGEGFFNLENGLQAYFIQDRNFALVDTADPDVVTDPESRDRAVAPGLSCLGGCHLNKGILAKDDQVRAYIESSGPDAATRERVFGLYPEVAQMRELMQADAERYLDAVAETGLKLGDPNAINVLVRKHQDVLHLAEAAAVLGVSEDELLSSLQSSPQAFPAEILTLRQPGGTIYRDSFDLVFADVVTGLGLGEAIRPTPVTTATSSSTSSSTDTSSGG